MPFPQITFGFSPTATVSFPASTATSTPIAAGNKTLLGMIVTTSGGGQVTIYDTSGTIAAGTIVGITANAAGVGPVAGFPLFGVNAVQGLLYVASASSPAVTVIFS